MSNSGVFICFRISALNAMSVIFASGTVRVHRPAVRLLLPLGARVVPYFVLILMSLRLPLRRLPASECVRITARQRALNILILLIRLPFPLVSFQASCAYTSFCTTRKYSRSFCVCAIPECFHIHVYLENRADASAMRTSTARALLPSAVNRWPNRLPFLIAAATSPAITPTMVFTKYARPRVLEEEGPRGGNVAARRTPAATDAAQGAALRGLRCPLPGLLHRTGGLLRWTAPVLLPSCQLPTDTYAGQARACYHGLGRTNDSPAARACCCCSWERFCMGVDRCRDEWRGKHGDNPDKFTLTQCKKKWARMIEDDKPVSAGASPVSLAAPAQSAKRNGRA